MGKKYILTSAITFNCFSQIFLAVFTFIFSSIIIIKIVVDEEDRISACIKVSYRLIFMLHLFSALFLFSLL